MKIKANITKKYAIISVAIVLATVIIDYITKLLVMKNMVIGQSIPLIKDVLHLTYTTNDGAAFGWFDDARWLFMTASGIMIVGFAVLLVLWDDRDPLFYISGSLLVGGGIGNMIDRIFYGEVVDFIDFCAFDFWVYIFNGADSFVCVGVGLLLIYYIRAEVRAAKAKKAETEACEAQGEESEE